jgi:anti-sigma-K factor RskA
MDATDEFILEHFGTKGMKWGVRKAPKNARKADKEKVERRRKNVKRASIVLGSAAAATAIAVGAMYAKKHMTVPVRKIPSTTSDQHKAFIEAFNNRQATINKNANDSLRDLYERNSTPIHMRDYLSNWK